MVKRYTGYDEDGNPQTPEEYWAEGSSIPVGPVIVITAVLAVIFFAIEQMR